MRPAFSFVYIDRRSGLALQMLIVRVVAVFLAAAPGHAAVPALMGVEIRAGDFGIERGIGFILALVTGAGTAMMAVGCRMFG